VVVDSTWRSPDGRWEVDLLLAEPGRAARIWDEGELAVELATWAEIDPWLAAHRGRDMDDFQRVETDDSWCE
jgi:hypothetical protein